MYFNFLAETRRISELDPQQVEVFAEGLTAAWFWSWHPFPPLTVSTWTVSSKSTLCEMPLEGVGSFTLVCEGKTTHFFLGGGLDFGLDYLNGCR